MKVDVLVIAHNCAGEVDTVRIPVEVSEQDYAKGVHLERAKYNAYFQGFDAPYLAVEGEAVARVARGCEAVMHLRSFEQSVMRGLREGMGVEASSDAPLCI